MTLPGFLRTVLRDCARDDREPLAVVLDDTDRKSRVPFTFKRLIDEGYLEMRDGVYRVTQQGREALK